MIIRCKSLKDKTIFSCFIIDNIAIQESCRILQDSRNSYDNKFKKF